MSWQILILLQTLLVAASTISLRILARDKETANASFVINAGAYLALYVTFLALSPWLGHINWHMLSVYWWRFAIGGLAFALTNVFTYKTLVYFDAAMSTIVGTLNTLFTIIGAALVLNEVLSLRQAIGALILILAISYSILDTHPLHKQLVQRSVKLGVFFAFLAAVCFGIAAVNEKWLLMHMTVGSYAIFGIGGQFIMAIMLALASQPKKLGLMLKPRVAGWSLGSGILRGLGGACFILAEVRSNNVALVSVISNFKIIIVALLGWWLLQERQHLIRRLSAATTAIIGLTVMLWK